MSWLKENGRYHLTFTFQGRQVTIIFDAGGYSVQ